MKQCIRVWHVFDVQEVAKHLLIMGDLTADCGNCRELGVNPWKAKTCPKCGTSFQYLASRRLVSHPGERFQLAQRVFQNRPDLQIIDYDDFQKASGHQKARDFFKS